MVVWDPRLTGSFPPESRTLILPPWWRSEECEGTFGSPGSVIYQRLPEFAQDGGRFPLGHPQSDDMEGKNIWDPTVPETLRERMRWINIVHRRRVAILTGEADAELAAAV